MSDDLGENLPFGNKKTRLRIWLWLILLATVAAFSSQMPWLDNAVIHALVVALVATVAWVVGAWIWDAASTWFECVRPNPVPPCPESKARYWPGGKLAQARQSLLPPPPTEDDDGISASEEDDGA